jgi:uncharacterized Tic20 family protein
MQMTDPTSQPAAPQPAAPLTDAEDRQWASFAHFGNILGFIPPLIIWLIFKDRGQKANVEGKEALNWAINVVGAIIALSIVLMILGFIPFINLLFIFLGPLLYLAIWVLDLIFAIQGGIKVNAGGSYRYRINIRWIK